MFLHSLRLIAILALLCVSYATSKVINYHGVEVEISGEVDIVHDTTTPQQANQALASTSLPPAWDWRAQVPGSLTIPLNQHIPVYCGSCWAHATASSIADRMKIMTHGTMPDQIPSVQALINCGKLVGTCSGGDAFMALRWIHDNGIPDTTCQAYVAQNGNCDSDMSMCMTCDSDPKIGCYAIKSYPKITLSSYGATPVGDKGIMNEIYNRGPVVCLINSDCIHTYTSGVSMYNESASGGCKKYGFNHYISLLGWGTDENGVDYWIGRNSWGTYWGENGFFRIVRGGAYDPISCVYGVPNV